MMEGSVIVLSSTGREFLDDLIARAVDDFDSASSDSRNGFDEDDVQKFYAAVSDIRDELADRTLGDAIDDLLSQDEMMWNDLGPNLTCSETDTFAHLLKALARNDLAEILMTGHSTEDDRDDRHYIGDDYEEGGA